MDGLSVDFILKDELPNSTYIIITIEDSKTSDDVICKPFDEMVAAFCRFLSSGLENP